MQKGNMWQGNNWQGAVANRCERRDVVRRDVEGGMWQRDVAGTDVEGKYVARR